MKTAIMMSFAVAAGAVIGASGIQLVRPTSPDPIPSIGNIEFTSAPLAPPTIVTNVVTHVTTNTTAVDETTIESLQWEVQELRKLLAARNAELDKINSAREAAEKAREERRASWAKQREELRKADPEAYAEREKRREDFRKQMAAHVSDKTQFLKELDVSRMTEDELASHTALIQRIESTWSIIEAMQKGERPTREMRSQLHDNYRSLNALYETERDYVLREVGAGLGYNNEEAVEFSAYMKEIIELTEPRSTHAMMGGGHRSSDRKQP